MAALLAGTTAALGQGTGTKEAPAGTMQSPSTAPRSDSDRGTSNKAQPPDNRAPATRSESQGARDSSEKPSKNEGAGSSEWDDNTRARQHNDRTDTQKRGGDTTAPEGRSQATERTEGGAKLSTEQRTKITTVIRDQRVQPEANVNFNVSVGTRVPKSVHFHPLPSEIITIYPDWRGYEFFLVGDRIVVVNPRTLEIVAVLEA
jgi:hypothetical protein